MVTIKIILLGKNNFFPFLKHVAAIITDIDTERRYLLNFPFPSYDEKDKRATRTKHAMTLYQNCSNNICIDTVTLYSHQSYDQFLKTHTADSPFSWLQNNCANTVDKMLDFFFPQPAINCHTLLHLLSLDQFSAAMALPGYLLFRPLAFANVKMPADILAKAWHLSFNHGFYSLSDVDKQLVSSQETLPSTDGQAEGYDQTPDEWVMNKILHPVRLI